MYLSLYRKWRPRTFDEMCGQQHITSVLKKQCAQGRVSHAYLFCGTRGTGKTSAAKILAKAVNCENPQDGNPCNECFACRSIDNGSATDVLEIDAASNNKVENVRDLREEVVYPPSVLKKRVYIVDEVHMLTDSAFNALLKTLEEPPEYVVFILATTELSELPATIISRCMRFDFSRIDESAIFDRLMYVASAESIRIEKEAAELISHLADGALRDALSLLEACTNGYNGVLDAKAVRDVLGLAGDEAVYSLLHAIAERNVPDAIAVIDTVHRSSKDISAFVDDIASAVSSIIIDKQLRKFGKNANLRGMLPKLSEEFTAEQLFYIASVLEETQGRISRYAMNKRVIIELAVIRMCDRSLSDSPKALAARISELERRLALLTAAGYRPAEDSTPDIQPEPAAAAPSRTDNPPEAPVREEPIPFDGISDVYEYLSGAPDIRGFLQQASVARIGDRIIVSANPFTLEMLGSDKNKKTLCEAFIAATGKRVTLELAVASERKQQAAEKRESYIDELTN